MAVDSDDAKFTKQLKAAAILSEEAKKNSNHPGIAHYLIHSYDFVPLAAMCVETVNPRPLARSGRKESYTENYCGFSPARPHLQHRGGGSDDW